MFVCSVCVCLCLCVCVFVFVCVYACVYECCVPQFLCCPLLRTQGKFTSQVSKKHTGPPPHEEVNQLYMTKVWDHVRVGSLVSRVCVCVFVCVCACVQCPMPHVRLDFQGQGLDPGAVQARREDARRGHAQVRQRPQPGPGHDRPPEPAGAEVQGTPGTGLEPVGVRPLAEAPRRPCKDGHFRLCPR